MEVKALSEEKGEIVEASIIMPAKIEKTLEALKRFEDFKRQVLTKDDYVEIMNRKSGERKKYIKKSGWLKYALATGISLQLISESKEVTPEGKTIYHFTYRAIAPNGRYADAVGSASVDEREFARRVHDVRALAQTRAMERAISNLVGGGELGAEEILGSEEVEEVEEAPPRKAEVPKQEAKVETPKVEFEEFPKLREEALKELNVDLLSQLPWRDMSSGQLAPRNEWKIPAWIRAEEPNLSEIQQNILDALKEKLNKEGFIVVDGMRLFFNETKKYIRRVFE
jgi:hypothetical protein